MDRATAFRALEPVGAGPVQQRSLVQTPVDNFIQSALEQQGLSLGVESDRERLLRRLSIDLTGLPSTPENLTALTAGVRPDAFERAIDRMLASPQYGERWGKVLLDAAGYADSNGYFDADTDRPWAYKYRDYVIRSTNVDRPFDQFVREQLAGDELAGYSPGGPVTPRTIELLTATHFLRNSQDGSSESDGNPDEVTVDRATVLEGTLQVTMNSLLGITIQCARCHEHKFEPIEHAEYYQLQSVFYPAFPFLHRDQWVGPVKRVSHLASREALADWERHEQFLDTEVVERRREFGEWQRANRPPSAIRFHDYFDDSNAKLAAKWSNVAPGDDTPGGDVAVNMDSDKAPGARMSHATLELLESGAPGNRWLSTRTEIDWTLNREGAWVQVTFDLVSDRAESGGTPAARIGYYIALHDFDDSSSTAGGNMLIDGNPAGGATVQLDYPGEDAKDAGSIGTSGYRPGSNYGVRVTNVGEDKFHVEQIVDWLPEEKSLTLAADDLPDGGFGFEFCCGRSFVVDNVIVESYTASNEQETDAADFAQRLKQRSKELGDVIKATNSQRIQKPGALAWITDLVTPAPQGHRLERGAYSQPAEKVAPAGLAVLTDHDSEFQLPALPTGVPSSGRRLAFARWMTRQDSRPAALLARVLVNRIWQHHFGRGLVTTTDNFGRSGAPPTHPQLLDYLASELVRSGWSMKAMHRLIVHSAVYRQSSERREAAMRADPENRLWWRFPMRRLDAEAIRDTMLTVSGELDERMFGPCVATQRLEDGNVVVDEGQDGGRRRGIYLQQRRTQMNSLLSLFDAPTMVSTCGQRSSSTVPLQSLALLNSTFVRKRSEALARRVVSQVAGTDGPRVERAFQLSLERVPEPAEQEAALQFLQRQRAIYEKNNNAEQMAMTDFCQMLFASNSFLYIE